MWRVASRYLVAVMAALLATGGLAARPSPVAATSPNVVISQVYGGGGNSGATYTHDFVELFNRGSNSVSLAGWSLQYASATGTGNFGASTTQITELPSVSIGAGQYLLVQEASTAAVGSPLPTPDFSDPTPITLSGSAGKVALVNTATPLGCNGGSTLCGAPALAQIVDLVGYGTANFFEGAAAAPTLTNTTAAFRANAGCSDTDNNGADFSAATPAPRNTATSLNSCPINLSIGDVSQAEGDAGTTTFTFTVSLSGPAPTGGVTFDIATADDTATVANSDYAAASLTGQSIPEGSSTYTLDVSVGGDATNEANEAFFVNVTNVVGAAVADGQAVGTIGNDDVDPCTVSATPIHDIQGSGLNAAITGTVTVQGVVVGDNGGATGIGGFYVQEEVADADADPATSEGIFVYTGTADLVTAGQLVRVTGYARERFNQTTINASNSNTAAVTAGSVLLCGSGFVTPVDVILPWATSTSAEAYEGMLVRLPQELVIAEYFNYDRFGEIVLAAPLAGEARPMTPTAVEEPGPDALARAAANLLSRITLDDGVSTQNPSSLRHPNGSPFALDNRFRGGDTVSGTVGVLGYDFNLYRIFPTGAATYTEVNTRTAAPEEVGGRIRVAAMNTLNYFLTLDTTTSDSGAGPCGGLANLDCRGADSDQPLEFGRQRAKLIAALAGLDADVIGLNEIENTPGVSPLGDPTNGIVAGLNDIFGAGTYDFIDTGVIGTDAIRVGFIYRPAAVTPVGSYAILDSTVDPRFDSSRSRPALAQTFEEVGTGARFTAVVNHLKSKGSACAGDPDAGDGQGNCNGTRTLAAQALVDWLATDPTGSGDPDFLIVGDLNSYAMEDPIDAVRAGSDDTAATDDDYTNLIAAFQGEFAYSYTFDGQAGYLDHALATGGLAGQVTGAADWHINSDEPDVLDYDTTFKSAAQDALYEPNGYRSSDHDPVVIGLDLDAPPTIVVVAGGECGSGVGGTLLVEVGDLETAAGDLSLTFEGSSDTQLVADAAVVVSGSGASRTIAVTAAARRSGTAVLTFSVSDGVNSTTLVVTVVVGTDDPDVLVGTSGADMLFGKGGNDLIGGLGDGDLLCGGNGIDTLVGGDGDDSLDGGRGGDVLFGGEGDDVLRGGAGNDLLLGEAGDDALTGGLGADWFSGGDDADTNVDLTPSQGDGTDGT